MINFLKCEGEAVIKLILKLSYQEKDKVSYNVIEVSSDNIYRIRIVDSVNNGISIKTICGRIISFTMCPEREVLSYVNNHTKPSVVDTITIDCSGDGKSNIRVINICDIRSIEELCDSGFEDISQTRPVPTFK